MRIKGNNFLSVITLLTVLLLLEGPIWAQSGRTVNSTLQPEPIALQQAEPLNQVLEKSKSALDKNTGKFKFIFPANTKGRHSMSTDAEYKQGVSFSLSSLIEEMNRVGADGYRLVSAVRMDFVALMKFDEGQYEYRHFELINNFTRWRADFNQQHDELTQQGFRFADFYTIYVTREVFNPQVSTKAEREFTNSFFYEKDKSATRTSKQLLVTAADSASKQSNARLSTQIVDKFAAGYYPVSILSPSEILLEQAADKDDLITDKFDVQIVAEAESGDIEQKVNALAKQGYRVGLVKNGVFVLYRLRNTQQQPVLYAWVEPYKKNFEKELAKMQTQGAVYRDVYVSINEDFRNKLLFEVRQGGDGKRREYKALKFDFDYTENEAENNSSMQLRATSQETLKTMERLVKEGFEVRDLFFPRNEASFVNVILERESK